MASLDPRGMIKHGDDFTISMGRLIEDVVINLTGREEGLLCKNMREFVSGVCLDIIKSLPVNSSCKLPIGIKHHNLKVQVTDEVMQISLGLCKTRNLIATHYYMTCPTTHRGEFGKIVDKYLFLQMFKRDLTEFLQHYYVTSRKAKNTTKYGKGNEVASANIIQWTPEVLQSYLPFTDVWGTQDYPSLRQIMEEDDIARNRWGHIEEYIHYLHGMNLFCK